MPNRIIKESINESKGLSECSLIAVDLYKRLITYADDYGRFNADTTIMLARLYPRELESVTQDDVISATVELVGAEKIGFYTSEARRDVYGCFPNWGEHQRVRQSRKKYPDPDDTTVNDWYCQRFVPVEMKIAIIERDSFKCCECGKYISTERDARRLVKQANGMYHIDHVVPVNQGGRATMENLRLTCPTCNRTRKKQFSFSEIVAFAASGGELPRVEATGRLNPIRIQSESISESESNPILFDAFWSAYPKHAAKADAQKAFKALNPDDELMQTILTAIETWRKTDDWTKDGGKFVPLPATYIRGKRWEDELPKATARPSKEVGAHRYDQRQYTEDQLDAGTSDLVAEALRVREAAE